MAVRRRRWAMAGLLVLAAALGLLVFSLPYLPVVHGSDADEVARLAEWLGVEPGDHVADVGAGEGEFALTLARRVGPEGHVYATELSRERLEQMRAAVAEQNLDNVSVVEGAVADTNLPAGCCDAIYSRNVYHHLTEPDAINADLRRALRPGGRLLVIDFEPGGPLDRIATATEERHGGHGAPKQTVVEEVTEAGFRVVRGPEPWRGRLYAVMFEKPSATAAPDLPATRQLEVRVEGQTEQRNAELWTSPQGYAIYVLPQIQMTAEEPGKDQAFARIDGEFFMRIERLDAEADATDLRQNARQWLGNIGDVQAVDDPDAEIHLRASNPQVSAEVLVMQMDAGRYRLTLHIPNREPAEGILPSLRAMMASITTVAPLGEAGSK